MPPNLITIYAVVEGQTEERFCKDVLNPHYFHHLHPPANLEPKLLGLGRPRANRGGSVTWERVRGDLARLQKEHGHRPDVGFTTLIDLYRLPMDFPGMASPGTPLSRVQRVEMEMASALPHPRFVPYLQLHEFEALLFCDCSAFEQEFPGTESQWTRLAQSTIDFTCPEDIDQGPDTSPAKRIATIYPSYRKTAHGPKLAAHIGLASMRSKCPHFSDWLDRLSRLANAA